MEQLDLTQKSPNPSAVETLGLKLGRKWDHLRTARALAIQERQTLQGYLSEFTNADTSIVVVGSLGRDEFTPGSDVDWTLLIDGIADPGHLDVALEIRKKLGTLGRKSPGREGTFGSSVQS